MPNWRLPDDHPPCPGVYRVKIELLDPDAGYVHMYARWDGDNWLYMIPDWGIVGWKCLDEVE